MEILEVIARWLFWLFDGIGVNKILKKIAKNSEKKKGDDTGLAANRLACPPVPQL
jgi:hypothetical protein